MRLCMHGNLAQVSYVLLEPGHVRFSTAGPPANVVGREHSPATLHGSEGGAKPSPAGGHASGQVCGGAAHLLLRLCGGPLLLGLSLRQQKLFVDGILKSLENISAWPTEMSRENELETACLSVTLANDWTTLVVKL